jgi:Zn-dependent peptidase ImmA (M78 family)
MSASLAGAIGALADQYRRNENHLRSAMQREGVSDIDRARMDGQSAAYHTFAKELQAILLAEDDRLEHRQWRA